MRKLLYGYRYLFITLGLLSVVILTLFYNALKPEKQLPIYTPAMVNPELVDSLVQHKNNKLKHIIADFSFQNQNNQTITQDDYKDVIYVADRSEEHTSELQSRPHLVCRLLLEK